MSKSGQQRMERRNEQFDDISDICANGSLKEIVKALNLEPKILAKALSYRHSLIFARMVTNHNVEGYKYIIENPELRQHIDEVRLMDSFSFAALNGNINTISYFLEKGLMDDKHEKIKKFLKDYNFPIKEEVEDLVLVHIEKNMIEKTIKKSSDNLQNKDNRENFKI